MSLTDEVVDANINDDEILNAISDTALSMNIRIRENLKYNKLFIGAIGA
jgi:hypothetical protein